MSISRISLFTSLSIALSGLAYAVGDDHQDTSNLVHDFDPSAGVEIAIPRYKFVETTGDAYPDWLQIAFDVYPIGSSTPLYQSAGRSFRTPTIPVGCTAVTQDDLTIYPNYIRAGNDTRVTISIGMALFCVAGTTVVSSENTAVYSANLDGTGGEWRYFGQGLSLVGSSAQDTDNNGSTDTVVVMMKFDAAVGENTWVVTLNANTGSVNSSTGYPLVR